MHFCVLVLSNDNGLSVNELLDPYCDCNTYAPHIEFTKQEAIDYVRQHPHYAYLKNKTDEECWKFMAEGRIIDKKGNIYTTDNPNAHWDWWVEGGRWDGLLRLKESGDRVNSARIGDIDFSLDDDEYKKALRFWDIIVDHKPLYDGEKQPFNIYKEDYYRKFYGDRETYAKRQAIFSTFAVVTSNGIWIEKASKGWFNTSSETPESRAEWEENFIKNFIEDESPDTNVTIVDCHI